MWALTLSAQQFVKVGTGPLVNTPSDSRGVNFLDLNGDLRDDIFITNGPSSGQNNMLYLNEGGAFAVVDDDPITTEMGRSDGATFGDVDNDGDPDAYVVNWYGQRNFFYRNNGDGTFTYEPATADGSFSYSETAAFGDYDGDGWLDLYVTNSTNFTTNTSSVKRNQLFRNDGSGGFDRITSGEPVTDANISRSVQWVDYDMDGDLDLWVSNEESEPNYLYENNDNVFTKRTDIGLNEDRRNSTGSSWADVDNDGDFDLFVANFGGQRNQLFLNDGSGRFTEVVDSPIAEDGGCSFGSGFADFDNDGDVDLFVASGFCGAQTRNLLYQNDGQGNFTKDESSITSLITKCSYGTAWGDVDDDGYLDLVVANCQGNASTQPNNWLYRNLGGSNNFVKFSLKGTQSNHSAIGAIVRVKATINGVSVWQTRMVEAQSGYCGQNSLTQHFGMGDANVFDSLIVQWPSGEQYEVANLFANSRYEITEAGGSTSVNEIAFLPHQLEVFPNPVDSQLNILVNNLEQSTEAMELQLLGANGKEMGRYPVGNERLRISVANLPAGVYFARLWERGRSSRAVRFSVMH